MQKTVNILSADGNPENLSSLEDILKKEGRRILNAASGNEALKIAEGESLSMILLDEQLPEMDGFEVARQLKSNARTKDIAIIFTTAIGKEERYALQGFEEGAVDFLRKPFDANIVKAKVTVFEKLYLQQEEMKERMREAQHINKQLDEFVYIVSHDLKAPLRGIGTLATFIEDELGPQPNPKIM